jgi:hypothetical protein
MPRRDYDDDSDLEDRPRRRRQRPVQRRSDSNVLLILACVGAFLVLMVGAGIGAYFWLRGQTEPALVIGGGAGGDLDRLSGTWECTFRDGPAASPCTR